MPIKNYTTKIPSIQTINEIQKKLVEYGATRFMIEYEKAEPSGLAFIIPTKDGDIPFQLPVKVRNFKQVLENQRVRSYVDWKMAARVAWRNAKDWVESQLSQVEADQVTIEQIFLPYMLMPGEENKTLYDALAEKGFYLAEGRG